MNYLKITNKGLVEAEDLYLIGSSTKRGDHTKIGMFGSGWKFSLAYFLRNNIDIKVFTGTKEIKIATDVVLHRNTPVQVVSINDHKTSITTGMGPDWTAWMAVREMVSNAIDEGEENIQTIFNPSEFETKEGITTLYIEMSKDLKNVMNNFDKYFTFERKADWISNEGHLLYLKEESSTMNIYRKGIRCFDTTKKTLIDYNFSDININESRLTSESTIDYKVRDIFNNPMPINILLAILKSKYQDTIPKNSWNNNIRNRCLMLIDAGYELTTGFIKAMQLGTDSLNILNIDGEKEINISGKWYSMLVKEGYINSPFDLLEGNNVPEGAVVNNEEDIEAINIELKKLNIINLNIKSGTWKDTTEIFRQGDIFYIKEGLFTNTMYNKNMEYASLIICSLPRNNILEAISTITK